MYIKVCSALGISKLWADGERLREIWSREEKEHIHHNDMSNAKNGDLHKYKKLLSSCTAATLSVLFVPLRLARSEVLMDG